MPPKIPDLEARIPPEENKELPQGKDGSFWEISKKERIRLIEECFDFPKIGIQCNELLTEAEKQLYIQNALIQHIKKKRKNRTTLENKRLIEDTRKFLGMTESEMFSLLESHISEDLKQRFERFYENLDLASHKIHLFAKYLEEARIEESQENIQEIANTLTALVKFLHQNKVYIFSAKILPKIYSRNIFEIHKNIKIILKEWDDRLIHGRISRNISRTILLIEQELNLFIALYTRQPLHRIITLQN